MKCRTAKSYDVEERQRYQPPRSYFIHHPILFSVCVVVISSARGVDAECVSERTRESKDNVECAMGV